MSGVLFAEARSFWEAFPPEPRRAEVTALACKWARVLDDSSSGLGAGFVKRSEFWAGLSADSRREKLHAVPRRTRHLRAAGWQLGQRSHRKTMTSALFLSKSVRHFSACRCAHELPVRIPPQEIFPWRHAVVRWRRTKDQPGASFLSTFRGQAKRPPQPLGGN